MAYRKASVSTVDAASNGDLQRIWDWNAIVPEAVDSCVHNLIAQSVLRQPQALAVCAWDGEWTYGELDRISTYLACHLVKQGVEPNTIVPLCFEKSKWVPVAILAVMKAGGASVILDTSQPEERLRSIINQVDAVLVLCSTAQQERSRRLTSVSSIVVDESSISELAPTLVYQTALPMVSPLSRLYIVFTSGSTGTPKGVMITHSNFSSAIRYQQAAHGFEPTSRVYDFASYAFDVSWSNILHTLTCGGCLCIPSDDERKNDLAGSIARFGITHADLTPSVARVLPSATFTNLRTVVLGGEKLLPDDAKRWSTLVDLKNPYGPSECTPTATIATVTADTPFEGSIGKGLGLNTWVVDTETGDELVSIGCVGELLLEGPLVGAGYLNDPGKTAAAFVENPAWLLRGGAVPVQRGRRGRLYRTGDLVRYNSDGSLIYVGRKDAQVKINGQRVELGDIEHHIRQHIPKNALRQVVAEMILPKSSPSSVLVAFLEIDSHEAGSGTQDELLAYTNNIISGLNDRLGNDIPSYMVPSMYIPLLILPLSPTGKTDRRKLRAIGESMDMTELAKLSANQVQRRLPRSPEEKMLRGLWCTVLEIDESNIGLDDSFLEKGGDSIAAMQLVSAARKQGLAVAFADIFNHPHLEEMVKIVTAVGKQTGYPVESFALIRRGAGVDQIRREAAELCAVEASQIEDVFPCTPLQEGLLSLSVKRDGDYVLQYALELRPTVDLERLARVWAAVVSKTPILRTRIVSIGDLGLMQVVIDEQWEPWAPNSRSLRTLSATVNDKTGIGLGTHLAKFELVKDPLDENKHYFVWTMHHALFDGWSMRLMLEKLERAYSTETTEMPPRFQHFIQHIQDVDNTEISSFWTDQFKDSEAQIFPMLPSPNYQPKADKLYKHSIDEFHWPAIGITVSSAIRAAYAILISHYTDSSDVIFGTTATGRHAPVPGVEDMIAPTIATVPVRIAVDRTEPLWQFMQKVQSQTVNMIGFEQTGLHRIRRISAFAEQACQFQTLLVVQPAEETDQNLSDIFSHAVDDINHGDRIGLAALGTYGMTLEFNLKGQGIDLHISYDPAVLGCQQVQSLAQQFEHSLRQICVFAEKLQSKVNSSERSLRQPTSEIELQMQKIWALVLNVDRTSIGLDDSFFQVGGDSLAAMKVVREARQLGFTLSVEDIFRRPSLKDVASHHSGDQQIGTDETCHDSQGTESITIHASRTGNHNAVDTVRQQGDGDEVRHVMIWEELYEKDTYAAIDALKPEMIGRDFVGWTSMYDGSQMNKTELNDWLDDTIETIVDGRQSFDVLEIGSGTGMILFNLIPKGLKSYIGIDPSRKAVKFVTKTAKTLPKLADKIHIHEGSAADISQLDRSIPADLVVINSVAQYFPSQEYLFKVVEDLVQFKSVKTLFFGDIRSYALYKEFRVTRALSIAGEKPSKTQIQQMMAVMEEVERELLIDPAFFTGLPSRLPDYIEHVEILPKRLKATNELSAYRYAAVVHVKDKVQPSNGQKIHKVPDHEWIDFAKHGLSRDSLLQLLKFSSDFSVIPISNIPNSKTIFERHVIDELDSGTENIFDQDDWLLSVREKTRKCPSLSTIDLVEIAQQAGYQVEISCSRQYSQRGGLDAIFHNQIPDKQQGERRLFRFPTDDQSHLPELLSSQPMQQQVKQKVDSPVLETENIQVGDIKTVSEEDMRSIWAWNANIPEALDICVHSLIKETVLRQPQALAVCAWDGDWTYAQLDDLSNRLAQQLVDLGVSNTIVPVCFEKSKWTPVALLAVMKAGGASVTMDTSQPEDRLRSIVSQVNPLVILSSLTQQKLANKLTAAMNLVVDESSFSESVLEAQELPVVKPSSRLYLVFTSGSTGTPKGVMITHSNFSSAIRHQQEAHGFKPESRVYDFASYAFDVSWSNLLHTLTIGACLCIPSDAERRDNLAGSIDKFNATHVDLTPSAASVLPSETLAKLQTLVLGGEKLSAEYAERWSALVNLKNPYGPSECTPTATITDIGPDDEFKASIGTGLGLNTWVVDTATGKKLVPIGATGELLLEGPLVGEGYLGDPEKTASAFVEDPPFLQDGGAGHPGRRGRLYKTGDLVRYNLDGSLSFVGRKDAQVKINGQRVELSEIEHYIGRHPDTRQAACLLPKSGLCSGRLVGFFSIRGIQTDKGDNNMHLAPLENSLVVHDHIESVQRLLQESLPAYMVPSVWIALTELPLSTSGKLDHRVLQTWLTNMDRETFEKFACSSGRNTPVRESRTEMENALRDACSYVLNLPPSSIDLERSFIANGGDSISAMRLSSHYRARTPNAAFSVADLLRSPSLSDFAMSSTGITTPVMLLAEEEEDENAFGLAPIQQWYFSQLSAEHSLTANDYYNQAFYVKARLQLVPDVVANAIAKLVTHHTMLRARFEEQGGLWTQSIPKNGLHHFASTQVPTLAAMATLARQRHQSLDIRKGLVFAADLCRLPAGDQYLILIAHHLVVDLVSWRVILEDLETLLRGGMLQPSLSFQVWQRLQKDQASSPELCPENVLSTKGITNNLEFWNLKPETPNTVSDHNIRNVKIDRHTTLLLLSKANHAFDTEPVELLMSAVWDSFLRIFTQRDGLTIFSEGHGRESWSRNVDPSRTVGWFTTISPIHIQRDQSTHKNKVGADIVRSVKDARRRLPAHGWSYFTSRYLNENGREIFRDHESTMEVVLNYHGLFQQFEHRGAMFADLTLDNVSEVGPAAPASSLFGIEISIKGGETQIEFSFNRYIAHQDLVLEWIEQIGPSLRTICEELVSAEQRGTLCDYEFLKLDYQELDQLQDRIIPEVELLNGAVIEEVFPCTPTVDGMLLSQIKQPEAYKTLQLYEITSRDSKPLSLERLFEAWQMVVIHQPSLRSVFIEGLDGQAAFNQVVLKTYRTDIVLMHAQNKAEALEKLKQLPRIDYKDPTPPYRVALCRVPGNRVIGQIEMSHAITDGASTALIVQDWIRAYTNTLSSTNLLETTRSFVRAITVKSNADKLAYWRRKLAGMEPSHFPHLSGSTATGAGTATLSLNNESLDRVQYFCAEYSTTPSSFFQAAWGLTLAAYIGCNSVCFGYLASGRDLSISGLDESIGVYTNMMVCRIDLQDRKMSRHEFIESIHEQVMQDLDYQHCSLASIHHELGLPSGQALFNTIMSYQWQEAETEEAHGLVFKTLDGTDPTEYDISVSIGQGLQSIDVELEYANACLSNDQANRLLSMFRTVTFELTKLLPMRGGTREAMLDNLSLTGDLDLSTIWTWNATVPEPVHKCVHDMISATAIRQPNSPAVCAWDGEWLYGELDSLSTRLAYWLITQGVGPDTTVFLCFEKSKWVPVAMLATMKAGGAATIVDTSQPEDRLRSIADQVNPAVVLCSRAKRELASQLTTAPVSVVDNNSVKLLSVSLRHQILPVVSPLSKLYIVFTSGSTGTPKGVVITHSNFSSALHHQRIEQGVESTSRVYDFASYAFDVSWANVLISLTRGACLCIPSDIDRKGNLSGSIVRLKANFIELTPSTALLLSSEALNQLDSVNFGGERLLAETAHQWSTLVNIKNTYGPSECTPTTTFTQKLQADSEFTGSIGRGVGINTWIVDAATGTSLVPIGAVGELWLEGPLVGAGYLKDPDKTAAAFIEDPEWLLRGSQDRPGRRGRLYKTGDLVRYEADGSLLFVGRKDTQVKINGQRVELTEIENHIGRYPVIQQAAALVPKAGPYAQRLVGIFSLKERTQNTTTGQNQKIRVQTGNEIRQHIEGLTSLLERSLPAYMVPSVWISLTSLPVTTSGKLDLKALQAWLTNIDAKVFADIDNSGISLREPVNEIERELRDACSHILNIPATSINLERSFVANGGDSISAMRLSARGRTIQGTFSVTSLLKAKSLAEFASSCLATSVISGTSADINEQEDFDSLFPLSPIQKWYFNQPLPHDGTPDGYYNQAFYVKARRPLVPYTVATSIATLVAHHSMLRACFQKSGTDWMQYIPKPDKGLYHYTSTHLPGLGDMASLALQLHQSLNIEKGLVFAADLCVLPGGDQYLILVAHHLVVDLVSWRIILDDLETLLAGGVLQPSLPFQIWNKLQADRAMSAFEFKPDNVLSTTGVNSNLEFWGYKSTIPNAVSDHQTCTVELDRRATMLLLSTANETFNTEPVDILLSAVWNAFFHAFPERDGLTIFNEGHGREPWAADIDLSRTVGWFTTLSPLHAERTPACTNLVRLIKDARRKLPANGWAYFTSRYLNVEGKEAFRNHETTTEMVFNYHGQFQELENDDSLFENIDLEVAEAGEAVPASSLFTIEVSIERGTARIDFSFNRHIAHQDRIYDWIEGLRTSVHSICHELLLLGTSQRTLCDYEFLKFLDYQGLDKLHTEIIPSVESFTQSLVEDIFPCTPTVDGMLISQMKQPDAYKTIQMYDITSVDGIDFEGLSRAWQKVIAHHPSLRSVFIEGIDATAAFDQVVLAGYAGDIIMLHSQSRSAALDMLKNIPPADYERLRPPHRIILCQLQGTSHVICQVEMSHAITDGTSTNILIQDWINAYDGTLDSTNMLDTTRNFTRAVMAKPTTDKLNYWKFKLAEAEPCYFPRLIHEYTDIGDIAATSASVSVSLDNTTFARIQQFCGIHSVTPSSVFQAVWALVLSAYTGTDSVCFGYLASGRDLPIQGLEDSVGAFTNMMICRAKLQREMPVIDFLRTIHEQVVQDLDYQHTSLASIQHELNLAGQPLFNSLVSFQRQNSHANVQDTHNGLSFEEFDGADPTEYDVSLSVGYNFDSIDLDLDYSQSYVERVYASQILSLLQKTVIELISGKENVSISNLALVSDEDMYHIWSRNAAVPKNVETCVHDLITATARRQPQAPAVCAWDGEWTYGELDDLSTRLAYRLVRLGVTGGIVPLYFEKSKWVPVVMLAVMKAGGASVTIDTSQPEDRLRSIICQCDAALLLCSPARQDLASRVSLNLGIATFVVCDSTLAALTTSRNIPTLPMVNPSNMLYIVFTSGSTGTPKGVIITHSNFSSAIHHQRIAQGISAESRVFDFASYAFDVAWANALTSFETGACLCIPSDKDRKDDINGSILRLRITHADLTPSAALVLSKEALQQLDTLTLGGERLSVEDAKEWSEYATLKNTYGPSECTPTTTFTEKIDPGDSFTFTGSIGKGVGVNTWVVNPITGSSLAPLGSIGELLLEGPLVGAGYLGDPERTAAAFIEDPSWLLRGGPGFNQVGRHGRLYKTGDLVRYNADGSLTFTGRKDAQVKINGQRVELSEIENHVLRYSATRQAAVLIPKTGPCAKRLVAIFSLKDYKQEATEQDIQILNAKCAALVEQHVSSLKSLLESTVPTYMVPSVWIALADLPKTTSGKLNPKMLANWLATMDSETFAKIDSTEGEFTAREPQSEIESAFREACSHVLNVPSASINLDRSFIAIGGDSISAMRLSSRCRAANIPFSVAGLLKAKSLAEFVSASAKGAVSTATVPTNNQVDFDSPFPLSPIQQWYLSQHHLQQSQNVGDRYYNQSFYVKPRRRQEPQKLAAAFERLVAHHTMLRARFEKHKNGDWLQRVPSPAHNLHHFASMDAGSLLEIESLIMQRHQSLNIEQGPIFAADLYTLASGDQYLIMIAHHLVVDLVSWRIILEDLETLLAGETLQASLPFQVWNKLQTDKAISPDLSPGNVLSTTGINNDLEFWGFDATDTPNTVNDHDVRFLRFDKETTSLLLHKANGAFSTDPVELLLSAVWDAFLKVFPQRKGLTIFNEGHGREPWTADIDLSRTVGWFTTLGPIHIERSIASHRARLVQIVKDARRRLPANGWAYFTSRHMNESGREAFSSHNTTTEVVFNYHGQFQELEKDDSLFEKIEFEAVSDAGPAVATGALFEIEVSIDGGEANIEFSFNRHIAHQDRIHAWADEIQLSLQSICCELSSINVARHTLHDFEFLKLDYQGLDRLHDQIIPAVQSLNHSTVEDIFPCTPTVDGILLTQIKNPHAYKTVQLYEVTSTGNQQISPNALSKAWQKVVGRQPSLRSVFVDGLDSTAAFNQVVLTEYPGDVIVLSSDSKPAALDMLKHLPLADYQRLSPPHRIVLCQIAPNRVLCQVEMSHAITDGASTSIVTEDWTRAYNGTLISADLLNTTRSFNRAMMTKNTAEKLDYWKTKLTNIEPCYFPALSELSNSGGITGTTEITIDGETFDHIQEFCAVHSTTPASVLKSAWALTLAAYINTNIVCFGYLASGRDLPIPNLEKSIGAYTNMMVCRADIQGEMPGAQFVQMIHEQVLRDLDFQHTSLASIQHELNLAGRPLFNSILSFQRHDDTPEDVADTTDGDLVFDSLDGEDPIEYDVAISVGYSPGSVDIEFEYSLSHLSEAQASRVLSLLQSTVAALTGTPETTISKLNLASQEDINDLWNENATVPETIQRCVHDLIAETAHRQPEAKAVCAWDGDWTYGELDSFSTYLAYRLVRLGVGPETIVPLCFEKSKWAPVAILAVMKAGGASVTLDTNQPEDRLRSIIDQTDAALVLCSPTQQELVGQLSTAIAVLVVHDATLAALKNLRTKPSLPVIDPSSGLYLIFTSGSTGTPKGVMVTHANYSSAIHHQQAAHGFKPTSRVYDFASYAFDVSWSNLLHTLTCGACLCIPSDDERKNDLAGSIARLQATHVDITPSVARLLPPATLETIETMVLGGEKLLPEEAQRWSKLVTLKNPYGPSECTPTATITTVDPNEPFAGSIGKGLGLNTWVVNAGGNSLVPIGSVGELFLEGPLVGPGYLGDSARTAAAFVEDPAWLLRGGTKAEHNGRRGRLYKTGDLVRYNVDGSLTFVGRKDEQVKINGQRVELGEIEHIVGACLSQANKSNNDVQVVVEVVTTKLSFRAILVAFLSFGEAIAQGMTEADLVAFTNEVTTGLDRMLSARLPAYMIPASFITLPTFPVGASGKTDRRRLREIGESLSWEQLNAASMSHQSQQQPSTPMERRLQALWSSVLGIDAERIGASESFFRLGGDSIGAMLLVGAARENGLSLLVADILRHPTLNEMALALHPIDRHEATVPLAYEPFSLLSLDTSKDEISTRLQEFGIDSETVDDILPTTDQQGRLISMTYTSARSLLLYHTLDGKGTPDVPMLRAMCTHITTLFDMLRTVFVPYQDKFLQVVLETPELVVPVYTIEHESLAHFTEELRRRDMEKDLRFGELLTSFAIIHQTRENKYRVVARMSHAQHDGLSLVKMWNAFENPRGHTENKSALSFSRYISALSTMDRQAALTYWRDLLRGSTTTSLKHRMAPTLGYGVGPLVIREIPQSALQSADFTFSTILKAAWAYVLARNTASADIVFSNLTHGRGLPGTDQVFGACINVVPTRVVFNDKWRVRDLVAAVNAQQIASMPFEYLGSREIVRACTDWPSWAYAGSVVYHHNFDNGVSEAHDRGMHEDEAEIDHPEVDQVDVHVTSKPSGGNMEIELAFAPDVVSESQANQLASELCETITMFYQAMDMPLSSPQQIRALSSSLGRPVAGVKEYSTILKAQPTPKQVALAPPCPAAVRTALAAAWVDVLGPSTTIEGRETQSFFHLGGDLVGASLLSAHMERQGYRLSLEDIIENPTWYQQLGLLSERLPASLSNRFSSFITKRLSN